MLRPLTTAALGDHARGKGLRGILILMPATGAIAVTLAAGLDLRGWRLMERAPFAFPAGRMD